MADNGNGTSSLYRTAGTPQPLVVAIPAPGDPLGTGGAPTGLVFNTANGQNAFKVSGFSSTGSPTMASAVFLFAAEDGTILGWNPGVNPPNLSPDCRSTLACSGETMPTRRSKLSMGVLVAARVTRRACRAGPKSQSVTLKWNILPMDRFTLVLGHRAHVTRRIVRTGRSRSVTGIP